MFDNTVISQKMSENNFNKIKQLIETSEDILGRISDKERSYLALHPQTGIRVSLKHLIEDPFEGPGYIARVTVPNDPSNIDGKTVIYQEEEATSATARLFNIAEQKYEEQEREQKQKQELMEKTRQEKQEQEEAKEKAILETVESALDSLFN